MEAPSGPPRRPNRSAADRRAQKQRAEARSIQRFLKGIDSLLLHRGSQPSALGLALSTALRAPPAPSQNICRHYLHGQCTYGSSCRFAHSPAPDAGGSSSTLDAHAAEFVPMDTSTAEAPHADNLVTPARSQSVSGPGLPSQGPRTSTSQSRTSQEDYAHDAVPVPMDTSIAEATDTDKQATSAGAQSVGGPGLCSHGLRTSTSQPRTSGTQVPRSQGLSAPAKGSRRSRELSPQVRLHSAPAKPSPPDAKIQRRAGTPRATPPRATSPPELPSPLVSPQYAPSMPSSSSSALHTGAFDPSSSSLTGSVDTAALDPAFLAALAQCQAIQAALATLISQQQPPS